jgi:hypothetical protein
MCTFACCPGSNQKHAHGGASGKKPTAQKHLAKSQNNKLAKGENNQVQVAYGNCRALHLHNFQVTAAAPQGCNQAGASASATALSAHLIYALL